MKRFGAPCAVRGRLSPAAMRLVGYCSLPTYCLINVGKDSILYSTDKKQSVNLVVCNSLFGGLLACGITLVGKRNVGAGSGGSRGSMINCLSIGPLR